jgi:hypothetical protein
MRRLAQSGGEIVGIGSFNHNNEAVLFHMILFFTGVGP